MSITKAIALLLSHPPPSRCQSSSPLRKLSIGESSIETVVYLLHRQLSLHCRCTVNLSHSRCHCAPSCRAVRCISFPLPSCPLHKLSITGHCCIAVTTLPSGLSITPHCQAVHRCHQAVHHHCIACSAQLSLLGRYRLPHIQLVCMSV